MKEEYDFWIFDCQQDEDTVNREIQKYEEEIRREFSKISKHNIINKSMVGIYKTFLYFEKNVENTDYILYVFGSQKDKISTLVKDGIDKFISEGEYAFHYNADQLSWEIPRTIGEHLNKKTSNAEYWCALSFIGTTLSSNKTVYELWILEFDKEILEKEMMFRGKRHPFIEAVRVEWEYRFGKTIERKLCYNELFRRATLCDDFLGYYENDINTLSAMKYENAMNKGSILLIWKNKEESFEDLKRYYNISVTFREPIRLDVNNYKRIRKLLEITKKGLSLLMNDAGEIFAIGTMVANPKCNYYEVRFIGALEWCLLKNNTEFLYFWNMLPCLPDSEVGIGTDDIELLKRTFADSDIDELKRIINCAIEQEHGTMIVFAENAKREAKRLKESGICIMETKVSDELVKSATSIDGAMICDERGVCYSIGTILDGKKSENADSSRGARYNSAIRYIEKQKDKKTFIVIVSEDKYVDCLSTKNSKKREKE